MTIKKFKNARTALESLDGPLCFGDLLLNERKRSELTQVELANKLKISKQELCNLEKKRRLVSIDRAIKFAKILKRSEIVFVQVAIEDQLRRAGWKTEVLIKRSA